jgi:hypothetical protein
VTFLLEDRAALRRAFYRLTGSAPDDDGLTEHDSEALEAVHQHLQYGLWDAQEYLVSVGEPGRWVKAATLTGWTSEVDGRRYIALPSDFLRLAGDERTSALRDGNGFAWGALVQGDARLQNFDPSAYWLENERIYVGSLASFPTTLTFLYHHRHAVLETDSTAIDFPVEDRPLIVAFAAERASAEPWFPGGADAVQAIRVVLAEAKQRAARRARRTREPRKLRPPPGLGTHWWS